MVTNATGRLAAPTNFFSANQFLLNQAVSNVPGFGAGGGGGSTTFDGGQFGFSGGAEHLAAAASVTNINLWGTPSFPLGNGFSWQMEPINNTFIILDTNGNVALQITNNLLGAQLFSDLTIASNLWFGMNNPTIHNHGTAQWSGNLNIAG
jgi:hypothetical protein